MFVLIKISAIFKAVLSENQILETGFLYAHIIIEFELKCGEPLFEKMCKRSSQTVLPNVVTLITAKSNKSQDAARNWHSAYRKLCLHFDKLQIDSNCVFRQF